MTESSNSNMCTGAKIMIFRLYFILLQLSVPLLYYTNTNVNIFHFLLLCAQIFIKVGKTSLIVILQLLVYTILFNFISLFGRRRSNNLCFIIFIGTI